MPLAARRASSRRAAADAEKAPRARVAVEQRRRRVRVLPVDEAKGCEALGLQALQGEEAERGAERRVAVLGDDQHEVRRLDRREAGRVDEEGARLVPQRGPAAPRRRRGRLGVQRGVRHEVHEHRAGHRRGRRLGEALRPARRSVEGRRLRVLDPTEDDAPRRRAALLAQEGAGACGNGLGEFPRELVGDTGHVAHRHAVQFAVGARGALGGEPEGPVVAHDERRAAVAIRARRGDFGAIKRNPRVLAHLELAHGHLGVAARLAARRHGDGRRRRFDPRRRCGN